MSYHSELAAELDEYYDKWLTVKSKNKHLEKCLDLRDGHILWLREKLKDIAAMKDQPKAKDYAREALLQSMGGRIDH